MAKFLLPDQAFEKQIISGRITDRKCLTKNDQRTYLVSLTFEYPIDYLSGDSLAIYPENNDQEALIWCQVLRLNPEMPYNQHLTILEFLKRKVSLSKWSSKMSELLFKESKLPEGLKDLEPLDILKNLEMNQNLSLELLSLMPPQMPRYYSIASSPLSNPKSMDLLVSLNSFQVGDEIKFGLASSYLCLTIDIDTPVYGFIHRAEHFRVPDTSKPIIMIGPGTGIAPFRAFIQERIASHHHQNWLFFGERSKSSDFYFEDELSSYALDHKLKLSLAFSRDQPHKIYVQDLIKQQKHELYEWIQKGAILYVCGDAKNMAKDVEQTLIQIFEEFEQLDTPSARLKLRQMRKDKRYNLDVY